MARENEFQDGTADIDDLRRLGQISILSSTEVQQARNILPLFLICTMQIRRPPGIQAGCLHSVGMRT